MASYFVAKTQKGDFIGQLALEEIARQFHAGELPGDYVATKVIDPPSFYRQITQSDAADWSTVADLIAHLPVQMENPDGILGIDPQVAVASRSADLP